MNTREHERGGEDLGDIGSEAGEITSDILTGRARKAGHACYDETKQY